MRRFQSSVPALFVLIATAATMLAAPAVLRHVNDAQTQAKITLARMTIDDDDILARIDRANTAIAERVRPSVVHITKSRENSRGFEITQSTGAGWVFDTEGHIITNAHVVSGGERFSVEFPDGRVIEGRLVGADVNTDIAVIRVDAPGRLFPLERHSDSVPAQGQRVFAFGSPFGFKFSMSEGIISGLGRAPQNVNPFGGYTNFIQSDAAINPGNSGGPMVDVSGLAIGMIVAIATGRDSDGSTADEGDSAGISFAIPIATIEPVVDQLINRGIVTRGFLGIEYSRNGISVIEPEGSGVTYRGVPVQRVVDDGPAFRAGLRSEDLITHIKGQPITSTRILTSLIASSPPGAEIPLTVYSETERAQKQLTVVLDPMPDQVRANNSVEPLAFRFGVTFDEDTDGVFFSRVFRDSPAEQAGIGIGSRLSSVNGTQIRTRQAAILSIVDSDAFIGEPLEIGFTDAEGESQLVTVRLVD